MTAPIKPRRVSLKELVWDEGSSCISGGWPGWGSQGTGKVMGVCSQLCQVHSPLGRGECGPLRCFQTWGMGMGTGRELCPGHLFQPHWGQDRNLPEGDHFIAGNSSLGAGGSAPCTQPCAMCSSPGWTHAARSFPRHPCGCGEEGGKQCRSRGRRDPRSGPCRKEGTDACSAAVVCQRQSQCSLGIAAPCTSLHISTSPSKSDTQDGDIPPGNEQGRSDTDCPNPTLLCCGAPAEPCTASPASSAQVTLDIEKWQQNGFNLFTFSM